MNIDVAAEVARRQQARLNRVSCRAPVLSPTSGTPRAPQPSRWAYVPLADLFSEQGNRLHARWGGVIECGHEPAHSSKSGRCVLINRETGRWLCRSCGGQGDAATLVV